VEAGAGYFVEKDNEGAIDYCNKKELALKTNANKIAIYINSKRDQMGKVQGEYNKRMLAM
jgi:prefoldin subunit 5